MPTAYITPVVPKNLEWWGLGRETTAGTVVAPTMTIPLTSGAPDDAANMMVDRALRGDMGEDYNEIVGTLLSSFSMAGNVYLDSIGHVLYNIFGDYQAQGTAMTSTGTVTGSLAVGANGATPVSITAPSGSAPFFFQIGNGTTDPFEVVTCSAASTSSVTISTPGTRFSHAAAATIKQVQAPFTHTFALLNGGGLNGLSATAQPITHTVTHYNGLAASTGFRQYGYWCGSQMDFSMNTNNLFQHATRGTAVIGVDDVSAPTNSQSDAGAEPNWRFQVAVGGTIAGVTSIVNNVEQSAISINRAIVPKFALANQQNPVTIARLGMGVTGRLTYIAQNESPLISMLAGTQQQIQIGMTNGVASNNAAYQAILFDFAKAQFEAATLGDPDLMAYDVPFRALMNTADIGFSGARGPCLITLSNAVPSY